MLGWMDDEALHRTMTSGRVTFYSRSRQEYWRKGDTSGHVQWVKSLAHGLRRRCPAGPGRPGRRRLPHRDPDLLRRPRARRRRRPGRLTRPGRRSRPPAHSDPSRTDPSPDTAGRRQEQAETTAMQDLGIISPGLEEFRELAGHSRVIPVRLKVLADAETPIGLYRKLAQGQPGHLPDGIRGGRRRLVPLLLHRRPVPGHADHQGRPGALARRAARSGVPLDGSPVDAIRDTVEALRTDRFDGLPPFTSGLVGFLGWETVRHWEKLTSPPEDDLDLPEMALNLVTDMAVHDNMDGTVLLIANAINFDNSSERVDEAWHDAVARVKALLAQGQHPRGAAGLRAGTRGPGFRLQRAGALGRDRVPGRAGPRQGSDRRRRGLPGGDFPPLRNGLRSRPAGRLPGPAEHQPQPVHVPLQPRGRRRPAVLDRRVPRRRHS